MSRNERKNSTGLVARDDTTTSFFVPDNSPIISYGPLSSSWIAGYALQDDGFDQTLHATEASNSTISCNLTATSFTLLVPVFTNCSATLTLNESSAINACSTYSSTTPSSTVLSTSFSMYDLPAGQHRIVWNAGIIENDQEIIFWGIDATRPLDSSGSTNMTIDNSYASRNEDLMMSYKGSWTNLTSSTSFSLSEQATIENDYYNTLAVTESEGASVTVSALGSAVYLYGTVGTDYGVASVTVDGHTVAPSLNLMSPWALSGQLLWFQTGLDANIVHNVTMTNLESSKMTLDFFILTADSSLAAELEASPPTKTFISTFAGKLVLYLAVPLTVLGVASAFIIWCFISHRKRSKSHIGRSTPLVSDTISRHPSGRDNISRLESWYSHEGSVAAQDVFVSYDEACDQRLSSRWVSPRSGGSGSSPSSRKVNSITPGRSVNPTLSGSYTDGTSNVASTTELPYFGGSSSATSSPNTTEQSYRWSRPLRSLLAASFTPAHNRATALPAYTPEGSVVPSEEDPASTVASCLQSSFISATEEKAALERTINIAVTDASGSSSTPRVLQYGRDVISTNTRPVSTVAPSDILSVFGAPPSMHRHSGLTERTAFGTEGISLSLVNRRWPPSVDTQFAHGYLGSLASSQSANSVIPILPFTAGLLSAASTTSSTRTEEWPHVFRTAQGLTMRSEMSQRSAARPDSGVIPFGTVIHDRYI